MNRIIFTLLTLAVLLPSSAQAQVTVILSEESAAFPTNPNAELGLFDNIEALIRRPDISNNGRFIGLEVAIGPYAEVDDTAVIIDLETGSQTVIAQQGVTMLAGEPTGFIADLVRVNNSGQAAFHTGDSLAAFWNGTTLIPIIAEGDPTPVGAPQNLFGTPFGMTQLSNSGMVGGLYDSNGTGDPPSSRDDFLLLGSTVLAAANTSLPGYSPQGGGTGLTEFFSEFDLSPEGTNWIAEIRFDDTPASDSTITVNGTVVAQEGITTHETPGGSTVIYDDIIDLAINDSGDWITHARSTLGVDYTLVNGVAIFAEGELAPSGATFTSMSGVSMNSNGDSISLWNTNDGNSIFILNEDNIILSEGDTLNVDYNGDGNLENLVVDGFPLETFNLADDGTLVLIVNFHDMDDNDVGNALITFDVSGLLGPSTLLGDVNLDTFVTFADLSPFLALLTSGGFQAEADINENGTVDFADISPFISLLSSP